MDERTTNIPPVIVQRGDRFFVEVSDGKAVTILAPLGDGAWFLEELVRRMVAPALRKIGGR